MEIFYKTQINKTFRTKAKPSTVKENLVWKLFGFVKSILSFTRMSVREINKAKKRTRICTNGIYKKSNSSTS